jgi:hypothetical protein
MPNIGAARPVDDAEIDTLWGQQVHDAIEALPAATARIDGFMVENMPVSANNVPMGRFDPAYTQAYRANPLFGRNGKIVALAWRLNTALTAGSLVLRCVTGGAITDVYTILPANGTVGVYNLPTPLAFVATNGGGMQYRTSPDFAPAGSNKLAVEIIVEYTQAGTREVASERPA